MRITNYLSLHSQKCLVYFSIPLNLKLNNCICYSSIEYSENDSVTISALTFKNTVKFCVFSLEISSAMLWEKVHIII